MTRPRRTEPGPDQESVWDYPRPPRLEPSPEHVVVRHLGAVVADTHRAWRVLETSQPPAYYLPPEDVATDLLVPSARRSMCEWKGEAVYFDVVVGAESSPGAAWSYPRPTHEFEEIRNHVAFYPQRVDACFVNDEEVRSNEGDFYGGWVTSRIVGPFKGGPGTMGW